MFYNYYATCRPKIAARVNSATIANKPFNQLNSTQLNEHLWTQVLKYLNVHICLVTIAYRYYNQLISRTDLSPIPVRSAA